MARLKDILERKGLNNEGNLNERKYTDQDMEKAFKYADKWINRLIDDVNKIHLLFKKSKLDSNKKADLLKKFDKTIEEIVRISKIYLNLKDDFNENEK